jgi:predicted DCC family thiol-disulfide oxidoreductase YuxK
MASLMAESLDVAMENFLKPTKYDKLTSLSKTLRDDPSCQLCTILVKYMMKLDMSADIEVIFVQKGEAKKKPNKRGIHPTLRKDSSIAFKKFMLH